MGIIGGWVTRAALATAGQLLHVQEMVPESVAITLPETALTSLMFLNTTDPEPFALMVAVAGEVVEKSKVAVEATEMRPVVSVYVPGP